MAEESFSQAFARAKREGKKTFMWKGKTYGTKVKGEDDSSNRKKQSKPSQDNYQSVLPLLPEVTVTPPPMVIICLRICLMALIQRRKTAQGQLHYPYKDMLP